MRARLALCVCLAMLGAVACRERSTQREYTLQGQVLSLAENHRQATINHEEIKGFMPAMAMPYNVRDPRQLDAIAAGDLVKARLVVLENDAYLTDVTKVGHAPLPQTPAAAPAPSASSGFELLKPGEAVPAAAKFVDQDGRPRTFAGFKGSTVVVTFIYTKCPFPTFCPLMDRHFESIQQALKSQAALNGHVRLVSVSFDPLTDTPPVLKEHAKTLGADPKIWTFLTGDRDDIDRFATRFGVSVVRSTNDPRDITHNLRTAIIDPAGKLVKVYVGNEWTPEQVLADLAPLARAS
jgi:protein SCO1/2